MSANLLPPDDSTPAPPPEKHGEYQVVARRYRPQDFAELVGQHTVSQGLANAIATNRVGHAYLFTGARGVGKTSTARIFAKSLNCEKGPTSTPCGECDICRGIASGEDVDVVEMDGASNRGIDNIRELRQNVNVRPSRARFKIYIIDEVHMLTKEAFNALLKTLEEPPEHVKFIFCTTEADRIPITILSRCQRFDFAPMEMGSILGRLQHIVKTEGIEVETEALQLIARRAAGSMRDSQSLLEQLMSFGGDKITAADVHSMLGTANGGRLANMAKLIAARDAAGAMLELDRAVNEGVDVGQFAEQLLGYFRDIAATVVGCGPDLLLHASAADHADIKDLGQRMGLETLLAAIQILDQSIARMRQSTHVRILVEMGLLRLCNLEDLDQLSSLVAQLRQAPVGSVPSNPRPVASNPPTAAYAPPTPVRNSPPVVNPEPPSQKKSEPIAPAIPPVVESVSSLPPITFEESQQAWEKALTEMGANAEMAADFARLARLTANSGPNILVLTFPAQYNYQKSACERADRKNRLEEVVSRIAGRPLRLEFKMGAATTPPPVAVTAEPPSSTLVQRAKSKREKERHPLVKQAMDLFDAEVEHVMEAPVRAVEDEVEVPLTSPAEEI